MYISNTCKFLKQTNRTKEAIVRRFLLDLIRSTSFFSFYGLIFCFVSCLGRYLLQKDHWGTTFFAGICGGFSLLAEDPLRREEVAVYCFPRIMEIVYRGLRKRGMNAPPQHSDIFIFSLSIGILMYFIKKYPQLFGPLHKGVFRIVFGKN